MANKNACPHCGAETAEIVWGYGNVTEAVDGFVMGGCVIDVDTTGRVAARQCTSCGTRVDDYGAALLRPKPAGTAVSDPFEVGSEGAAWREEEGEG